MVGLPRVSVRSWRWSATFPAAVGRAGTSEGVRGCLRVAAEWMEAEGGPGVAGIDGRVGVLCVLCGASVPLMARSGGEDVARSGRCRARFGRASAPAGSVE